MAQKLSSNAEILKINKPDWNPATNYLNNFFEVVKIAVMGIANNPNARGEYIHTLMKAVLGMVPDKIERERIRQEVENKYPSIKAAYKKRLYNDAKELEGPDLDACWKEAWIEVIGMVMDYESRAFHATGHPQQIGVLGPFGDRGMTLMSAAKLREIVANKAIEIDVELEAVENEGEGEIVG